MWGMFGIFYCVYKIGINILQEEHKRLYMVRMSYIWLDNQYHQFRCVYYCTQIINQLQLRLHKVSDRNEKRSLEKELEIMNLRMKMAASMAVRTAPRIIVIVVKNFAGENFHQSYSQQL